MSEEFEFHLVFRDKLLILVFEYYDEFYSRKVKLCASVQIGSQLNFSLKVLQQEYPGEVKRLVSLLEIELANRALENTQEKLLKYFIQAIKDLKWLNIEIGEGEV